MSTRRKFIHHSGALVGGALMGQTFFSKAFAGKNSSASGLGNATTIGS
ncbi:MAG: twin-arginine translocation signal domain-containing protein [Ferruginibacter sp.]|nr:twin-arginine translocation signal domain-containing protein [Ferruginibacter sp.]